MAYFIAYFFLPKLWEVAKIHKLTTLADYARERFDSKLLASLVAIVGVLMLIPYICLQLSGIQDTLQVAGTGVINVNMVVIISFILVALYTFFSGIKRPTFTAIIKDILVWVIMLFMVVSLPLIHFHGWTPMIHTLAEKAPQMLTIPDSGQRNSLVYHRFHRICAGALYVGACGNRRIYGKKRRCRPQNSMFLPLYNIVLILVIFLGFIAFLVLPEDTNPRLALLKLIQTSYGGVAQGFAYSTIALASLIPCSIMAIGASNLFANNLYRDLIHPNVSPSKLTMITRSMVFVVIGLALLFGMLFPTALVTLQLLGVSGMVQIFPAIAVSLFWKNQTKEATIIGLLVGLLVTFTVNITQSAHGIYEGFWGLTANMAAVIILNPFFVKKASSNAVKDGLFNKAPSDKLNQKGA
ncbi:sodium:solute symporter family protein [Bacillus sp. 4A_MP3]